MSFGNKRGDITTEEIVKTVLAIGVLIVIGLLFVALIKMVTTNLQVEQAKGTLRVLSDGFSEMKTDEIKEFVIESPKDWVFMFDEKKFCLCSPANFKEMSCADNQACVDLDRPIDYDHDGTPCLSLSEEIWEALDEGDRVWYKEWFPARYNPKIFETVILADMCFIHVSPVPRSVFVRKTNDNYFMYLNDLAYKTYSQNAGCSLEDVRAASEIIGDDIRVNITSRFSNCDFSLLKVVIFDLLRDDDFVVQGVSCRFSNLGIKYEKKISMNYVSGGVLNLSCVYPKDKIVSGKYKIKYGFIWEYASFQNGVSNVFDSSGLEINEISDCKISDITETAPLSYVVSFEESCGDVEFNAKTSIYDSNNKQLTTLNRAIFRTSPALNFLGVSEFICSHGSDGQKRIIKIDVVDLSGNLIFSKNFEHTC